MVCLFVCLYVIELLPGKCISIDMLYIVRSGMVLGRFISETGKIRTLFRTPLAEIRTVVGKIAQKWPFFRLFSNNFGC